MLTGPPLPETLRLLAPLASTLEKLSLIGNKLGGTITDDIAAFTKLTGLGLGGMGLEGACLYDQYNMRSLTTVNRTGELPLSIGRLKANGCRIDLSGNDGFTLSCDTSTVEGTTKLDFKGLGLRGMRCLCSFR